MLLVWCVVVFALAGFGWAQLRIDIKSETDQVVQNWNELMAEREMDVIALPWLGYGNITWQALVVSGLDTVIRTGDCNLIFNGTHVTVDLTLGLERLLLIFGGLFVQGRGPAEAVIRVRQVAYQFQFTIINEIGGRCRVTLDTNKMQYLGRAVLFTPDQLLQKLPVAEFLAKFILPECNRYLDSMEETINDRLQQICNEQDLVQSKVSDYVLRLPRSF